MMAASEPEREGGAAEDEAPEWGAVSELHLSLQEVLLELHKATARATRPGKRRADATEDAVDETALLEAGRRFERLITRLPKNVRSLQGLRLERELEELRAHDEEASREVEQLSARAEALRAQVDARWREACEELCEGAVTVSCAEEQPGPDDRQASASSQPGRAACEPSAGRGLRPRLQDLTQEKSRRFIEELEFVQCLANPEYVQWLATHHYFEEPAFVEFLKYLSYWRHPPHVYHVVYPQALRMLELLQNPAIRCRVHRMDTRGLLQGQMLRMWSHPHEVALEPAASAAPAAPISARATPASTPAPSAAAAGEGALREWDVLQDWTSLTGVVADKAWHEKVERINASVYTVQHDAKLIGMQYLAKNFAKDSLSRPQLDQIVQKMADKFQHFWADESGVSDLGKVLASQHTEPLTQGWEIPKEALARLAPAAASGSAAPARKRGRRS